MKLFILTQCAAEQNYTPRVFKTLEEAKAALRNTYDELVYERDTDGEIVKMNSYICTEELYDKSAEIIYADDTYDVFEIFDVEVE